MSEINKSNSQYGEEDIVDSATVNPGHLKS